MSGANSKDEKVANVDWIRSYFPVQVADFVEATIFSKDEAVIMLGTFATKREHPNVEVPSVSRAESVN